MTRHGPAIGLVVGILLIGALAWGGSTWTLPCTGDVVNCSAGTYNLGALSLATPLPAGSGGTGNTTSNAATANALAANGANCSAGQFPLGVDASGAVETCSTSLSGNASTATALAADPANCAANTFAGGITAAGVAESCSQALGTASTPQFGYLGLGIAALSGIGIRNTQSSSVNGFGGLYNTLTQTSAVTNTFGINQTITLSNTSGTGANVYPFLNGTYYASTGTAGGLGRNWGVSVNNYFSGDSPVGTIAEWDDFTSAGLFPTHQGTGTPSVTVSQKIGVRIENQGSGPTGVTTNKAAGLMIAGTTIAADRTDVLVGTTTIPTGVFTAYINGTAPLIHLEDATTGKKDLEIQVDTQGSVDVADFREAAGASGSLLALDLTNNRLGLLTAAPSWAIGIGGGAARQIGMEVNPTPKSAGQNLTINAGAAPTAAATITPTPDQNGGDLVLQSGAAMGRGTSKIDLQVVNQPAVTPTAGGIAAGPTPAPVLRISNGHIVSMGVAPSYVCGTPNNTPVPSNTDNAGIFSTGTGTFSSCVVSFAHQWVNPPVCIVNDGGATHADIFAATTTTTMTITKQPAGNLTADDLVIYQCIGTE